MQSDMRVVSGGTNTLTLINWHNIFKLAEQLNVSKSNFRTGGGQLWQLNGVNTSNGAA